MKSKIGVCASVFIFQSAFGVITSLEVLQNNSDQHILVVGDVPHTPPINLEPNNTSNSVKQISPDFIAVPIANFDNRSDETAQTGWFQQRILFDVLSKIPEKHPSTVLFCHQESLDPQLDDLEILKNTQKFASENSMYIQIQELLKYRMILYNEIGQDNDTPNVRYKTFGPQGLVANYFRLGNWACKCESKFPSYFQILPLKDRLLECFKQVEEQLNQTSDRENIEELKEIHSKMTSVIPNNETKVLFTKDLRKAYFEKLETVYALSSIRTILKNNSNTIVFADPQIATKLIQHLKTDGYSTVPECTPSVGSDSQPFATTEQLRKHLYPFIKGICSNCFKPSKFRCSKCKLACYCSAECQKNNWAQHKETH